MIQKPKHLENINNEYIVELIKEFYFCLENDSYPCFNAAMLIYRPLISHIANDLTGADVSLLNYYEIIMLIWEFSEIDDKMKDSLLALKRVADHINHRQMVLLDNEKNEIVICWNLIIELIEILYS